MKRAFLFGLGSFLIVSILGVLVQHDDTPSVIGALFLMPVSVIVIRAARSCPA
jgi:hypothetical protein